MQCNQTATLHFFVYNYYFLSADFLFLNLMK